MKNLTKSEANTISELKSRIYGSAPTMSETRQATGNPAKRITPKQQQRMVINTAINAIRVGDLAALARLVTTKYQANWHRPGQALCLLDEAVSSESVAILGWLLDMGACPNTLFFEDRPIAMHKARKLGVYFSPLAAAIHIEQTEMVILMLRKGASLDLPLCIRKGMKCTTCRDKLMRSGIWPAIEAYLIERDTPVRTDSSVTGRPRL